MKKKAFTLTELLVVVVIIGVLSAVVLPKFNKVLETRKTTEAEELMAAVRTEQEARCTLDKNYANTKDELTVWPKNEGSNYTYALNSTGISATSTNKDYKLRIKSYRDGGICCEGTYCNSLNKSYPPCDNYNVTYTGAECAAEEVEAEQEDTDVNFDCPGDASRACGCQNKGTQTRECDTSTGTWGDWSSCSVADACECTGTKPATSQTCNSCGTQSRSVTCDTATGEWNQGEWSVCSKTEADCAPSVDCCAADFNGDFAACIANQYGYDSVEYNCASGNQSKCISNFGIYMGTGSHAKTSADFTTEGWAWISGGYKRWACDHNVPCVTKAPSSTSSCNDCGTRSAIYECKEGRWEWVSVTECSKKASECSKYNCDTLGATRTETKETNCATSVLTYECVEFLPGYGYGHWSLISQDWTLKSGAVCRTGESKKEDGNCYVCTDGCAWKKTSCGGGGGSGGGGSSSCYRWTELQTGSFCDTCRIGAICI